MKSNKINYTKGPMDKVKRVNDFLPPPEDLVFKTDNVKVTISLSKQSIDFFKNQAAKYRTQYQKMIREVLDGYVARYG